MDFSDRIRELAARIPRQVEHIQTEEATKNAFIMPFIAALGYDVFNPLEVTPELHADVGSEDFVRFFAGKVYSGKMTPAAREKFTVITRRALRQFITDQLNERLKTALGGGSPAVIDTPTITPPAAAEAPAEAEVEGRPVVVTTDDEREAFFVVRAILREVVDVKRVALRDQQSYCGVLLDDNNRRPICRLYFNGSKKVVGVFDNEQRKEEKLLLTTLDDLYSFAPRFKAAVAFYIAGGHSNGVEK